MALVRILAYGLAGLLSLYLAAALVLTFWPATPFEHVPPVSPAQLEAAEHAAGVNREQIYPFAPRHFVARDGVELFAREFPAASDKTILLLHGITSDSSAMNQFSGLLRAHTGARVVALDIRGHGNSGGRRWSASYGGQYVDDVDDVLAALREEDSPGKIILAGHSMGGGIALAHALAAGAQRLDGELLISPLLGGDSPTMHPSADAPRVQAAEGNTYFRMPRLIGVVMFNLLGIRTFNHLPIFYFNRPQVSAYDFAALQGMQPNPPNGYRVALQSIKVPLLVIAGSRDEAFNGPAFPSVIRANSNGTAIVIDGANHNGVLSDPRTIAAIADWLNQF